MGTADPIAAPAIRILLTEDVPTDAELEVRELKRAGLRFQHLVVDTEPAYRAALREFAPDVILSDFSMPAFDGMGALAIARELCPDTPFIFVSGTIGEEYAIRALKSGATDYVVKTNLVRLPAAVERALHDARERRERRRTEAELEIFRERLTSIFTSLPDMLWSVDAATSRIVYVSPASRALYGREPDAFLQDRDLWINVIHPADQPAVLTAWDRMMKGGAPFDVDYRVRRPDGTERWVNDRGRVIPGPGGAPERIDGLARDITEQVEHRRRIARLSRIREFSSRINSTLVRVREREALFEEICGIALEVGQFAGAHVGVVEAGGRVRWAAQHGTSVAILQGIVVSASEEREGQGIVGRALRSRKPQVWNDLLSDEGVRVRERFLSVGVGASATFPLVVEDRAIGVFGLHAMERGFFDQDEMRMLEELSANVSFALELIAKQERIAYLALYDPLTALPNRTLFHERLTQGIVGAARRKARLALVLIDLERFKGINDTFGQLTGDRVLQEVARRLKGAAINPDYVARLGANLFAVILPGIGGAEEVGRRMEEAARSVFMAPLAVDGREVRLAAKAGVAVFPDDGDGADALVRNAEATLDRAKETGERYLFYTPGINARVAELVELEHRLRKAVEQGELFLHYQPKLDLRTRRTVGLEALMRWKAPDGTLVSPAKFVPVLEQTGLILEAGRQALAAASAAYRRWSAAGLRPPRIAVNVSALQLRRASFVEDVVSAAAGAGEGGVDLEITESLLMAEVDDSIAKLRALREQGVRIALDDFGTGFSSLAYLSKLPLDALKIDRAFIHGMTGNADDTSIVSTIISLAQALRLKVVAEGVETEEQAQLLRLFRCDQVQGFLFSRPLPAEDIEKQLKAL